MHLATDAQPKTRIWATAQDRVQSVWSEPTLTCSPRRRYAESCSRTASGSGVFLTEDPAKKAFDDPNLYRYVSNQPILDIDPMGMTARPAHPLPTEPPAVNCTNCKPAIDSSAKDALTTVCRNSRLSGGCIAILRRYGLYDCFRDKCGRADGGRAPMNVRCIEPGCGGCGGPCNNLSDVSQTIYLQPLAGSGLCGSMANTVAHEFAHMCGIGPDVYNAENQRIANAVAAACGGPR